MPRPTGLSSEAIHGWGKHHPHDPSDLLRCVQYCQGYLTTDQLRERMTGRSVEWDRLLPEWDNLVALLRQEMADRTDYSAPETYREMQRVIAGGITCLTCAGSGRGAPCPKCKGTGTRCGGRCRAPGCFHGSEICGPCFGRGYRLPKEN